MCGITGLVARGPLELDRCLLEAMTSCLRHRGPDAGGIHVDGQIGLGHRRLSIIDTSTAANQPLFNEDRSVAVIFNGEIYNYRELTAQLEQLGHRFRTRSDTEVLVHAWEQYGYDCVLHFRGMFAFCIYDAQRRELFLARDRLGKKPLYYTSWKDGFAFASEIKALLKVPAVAQELDLESLGEYVAYGNTLGERSIYRDIRRLAPGHWMSVDLRGEDPPRINRYWRLQVEPDDSPTEDDWTEMVDEALEEAVRLRLISDVPLGAFLSGGIDSSLVVAYMAKHSTRAVKTFAMAFADKSYDESANASAVARQLGTEHHEQLVTPHAAAVVDTLIDVFDEPFADSSAIPTFYLCETTRQSVTVSLSGDGGDESFLGYRRYGLSYWGDRVARTITPAGRSLLRRSAQGLSLANRLKRPLGRLAKTGFDHYNHAMGCSAEHLGLLRADIREQLGRSEGKMALDFRVCKSRSLLDRYAFTDIHNYLPDDVLVKVDRTSMHHSLEVRSPFLDHKVVELAARIPAHMKFRTPTGKTILRRILKRHLPSDLVDRPRRDSAYPWRRGSVDLSRRL